MYSVIHRGEQINVDDSVLLRNARGHRLYQGGEKIFPNNVLAPFDPAEAPAWIQSGAMLGGEPEQRYYWSTDLDTGDRISLDHDSIAQMTPIGEVITWPLNSPAPFRSVRILHWVTGRFPRANETQRIFVFGGSASSVRSEVFVRGTPNGQGALLYAINELNIEFKFVTIGKSNWSRGIRAIAILRQHPEEPKILQTYVSMNGSAPHITRTTAPDIPVAPGVVLNFFQLDNAIPHSAEIPSPNEIAALQWVINDRYLVQTLEDPIPAPIFPAYIAEWPILGWIVQNSNVYIPINTIPEPPHIPEVAANTEATHTSTEEVANLHTVMGHTE